MKFNLSNIQESNPKNVKLHDELRGMDCLIDVYLANFAYPKTYYYDLSAITLEKINNHIKFVITDLETNDKILGMAMPEKLTKFS